MGALDIVDTVGQPDHLLDPTTRIGTGEVLGDPPSKIGRGAHVEHFGGRPAEEIDPGFVRQSVGKHPLAALGVGDVGKIGLQIAEGCHAQVAHPGDQGMQHIDARARIIECAVRGRGGRAHQLRQRRQSHAGRLLAAQHPPGQFHGAQHRWFGPRDIALLRGGAKEAGIESGVVRHQD